VDNNYREHDALFLKNIISGGCRIYATTGVLEPARMQNFQDYYITGL